VTPFVQKLKDGIKALHSSLPVRDSASHLWFSFSLQRAGRSMSVQLRSVGSAISFPVQPQLGPNLIPGLVRNTQRQGGGAARIVPRHGDL